jgi:hypothetical protein
MTGKYLTISADRRGHVSVDEEELCRITDHNSEFNLFFPFGMDLGGAAIFCGPLHSAEVI